MFKNKDASRDIEEVEQIKNNPYGYYGYYEKDKKSDVINFKIIKNIERKNDKEE